ncbi:MAG: hypothetical protein U9N84_08885 [Actinomycetota bacterium]|nr:hypothetical protein [Actinomycetota bacterium]
MRRIESKLFQLSDEIRAIEQAELLASEELIYHQHLNDDAQRDAAVSDHPVDRADARETASDVARFERHLTDLQQERAKLETKRTKLIERLGN